jgi:hypothetical protein
VHGTFFIKTRRTVWIQSRYRTNKGGKEVMLIIVLKIPFSSEWICCTNQQQYLFFRNQSVLQISIRSVEQSINNLDRALTATSNHGIARVVTCREHLTANFRGITQIFWYL